MSYFLNVLLSSKKLSFVSWQNHQNFTILFKLIHCLDTKIIERPKALKPLTPSFWPLFKEEIWFGNQKWSLLNILEEKKFLIMKWSLPYKILTILRGQNFSLDTSKMVLVTVLKNLSSLHQICIFIYKNWNSH